MIDFHNHVLPDVDDGSKNMEMTLNMLKTASNQGIKKIINTIHLQHPKMDGKNTDFKYIEGVNKEVVKKANRAGIDVDIKLAAEVYYLPNLCDLIDNPLATINGYMLVEFPMIVIPPDFEEVFFQLRLKGIVPILAHPERYRFFQEDILKLQKLKDMGIIFQIDAGSLIGHFGKKTKSVAFDMLSNGYCHIIGSDAHNDGKRNFCLLEAYDIIESNHIISRLKKNSESIFLGQGKLESIKIELNRSFFKILKDKIFKT